MQARQGQQLPYCQGVATHAGNNSPTARAWLAIQAIEGQQIPYCQGVGVHAG